MKLIDMDLSDPEDFLNTYAAWSQEESEINRTTIKCDHELHSFWLCCSKHRLLQANRGILETWAHYFDVQYEMHRNYGDFLSGTWLTEFKRRANI